MTDGELTAALANLGLDRRNYRAVALLPLIEVAWADGRVQRAERQLIGRIAARYGMELGDAWLERWMSKRPSASTFLAARTVLLALMSRAGDDQSAPETLRSLLDLCLRVAESAGGLFGLAFTVERSEKHCIEEIATHLALGPAIPDAIVQAWKSASPSPEGRRPPPARRRAPVLKTGFSEATTRLRPLRRPPPGDPRAEETTVVRQQRLVGVVQETFDEDDPTVPFDDGLGGGAPLAGGFLLDDGDDDTGP